MCIIQRWTLLALIIGSTLGCGTHEEKSVDVRVANDNSRPRKWIVTHDNAYRGPPFVHVAREIQIFFERKHGFIFGDSDTGQRGGFGTDSGVGPVVAIDQNHGAMESVTVTFEFPKEAEDGFVCLTSVCRVVCDRRSISEPAITNDEITHEISKVIDWIRDSAIPAACASVTKSVTASEISGDQAYIVRRFDSVRVYGSATIRDDRNFTLSFRFRPGFFIGGVLPGDP